MRADAVGPPECGGSDKPTDRHHVLNLPVPARPAESSQLVFPFRDARNCGEQPFSVANDSYLVPHQPP